MANPAWPISGPTSRTGRTSTWLPGRKATAPEVDGEAALHAAEDRAHDTFLIGERLLEDGPGFLAARLVAREDGFAVLVLHAVDEDVDDVAFADLGGGRAAIGELTERDAAFGLQPDIDHDEIIGDTNDAALDDRAFEARGTAQRFFECCELRAGGVVRACTQGAALTSNTSSFIDPGRNAAPVGQPVKSGGSTALKHRVQSALRPQSPLGSLRSAGGDLRPGRSKALARYERKAAAKAASASMSLVSRW